MKRSISILLCLVLIFSSFSFAFADEWGSSQISSVVNDVSSIKTTLNNIYTRVNTITNYLYDSNHSIAYWTSAIASWMQPIYASLTSGLATNLGIDKLLGGLYLITGSEAAGYTYTPYLYSHNMSAADYLYQRYILDTTQTTYYRISVNSDGTMSVQSATNSLPYIYANGIHDIKALLGYIYTYEYQHRDNGYNNLQSLVSFADPDSTVTFRPISSTDGLYKYLNAINTPLARLGYVLASDSRIEAQEAASANEQAVVDNFIDPNGSGSASTSDFDSVADFSSGYQSTFSSDASPTGIFNLFTSDNMSWFSQETANQLDTTNSNNRAKSDNTFNTPLLDQQIISIYEQLGVKQP